MYLLNIVKQHRKKWLVCLLVIISIILVIRSDAVQAVLQQLRPKPLPALEVKGVNGWLPQVWLQQNWGNKRDNPSADTKKYHHLSQGTRTIPVPYDWFVNLETASSSLLLMPFTSEEKFIDNDHLLRLGFIRSEKDVLHNPNGLPIGFARTFSQNMSGVKGQTETVGFTCAACHTSHFVHDDGVQGPLEYIVEGGPATTDFGLLQSNLTAAIGQLLLSAKVPFMGARFDRFARNVLGAEYSSGTKVALSADLVKFAEAQLGNADIIEVTEGFTRLDALNRIGNAVFSDNIDRPQNKAPINAPVNYPHIWTTSWFDWVQYDASVMGPLIRNVGEALGVKAFSDVKSPVEENRFSSSIPIGNLVWIENFLSGPQPTKGTGFQGLTAPKWTMTKVDKEQAELGKQVYQSRCQGCHLPDINSKEIWNNGHIAPIEWLAGGQKKQTEDVLKLNIIALSEIGTDRQQAKVMINRTMDTSGNVNGSVMDNVPGMQINSVICARDFNQATEAQLGLIDDTTGDQSTLYEVKKGDGDFIPLTERWVTDGANISFGYALAATVEHTINAWFNDNGLSDPRLQDQLKEGRPNCIQAGMGYKARPLNGVWATPPFLHNGSIATLRDLLCPIDGQRPQYIQLGSVVYDINNMGIKQPKNYQKTARKKLSNKQLYDDQGYFILDTSVEGNRNIGHHFSAEYDVNNPKSGVIGPELYPAQCDALLEYLKTI